MEHLPFLGKLLWKLRMEASYLMLYFTDYRIISSISNVVVAIGAHTS